MPIHDAHTDAERLLRQTWQDEVGTIPIPVDPIRIAGRLGINVYEQVLNENLAGVLMREVGKDPMIVLNEADHPNRKRFTCAHEIGHWIRKTDDEYRYFDKRDAFAAAGVDSEEMYANAFAASLLMPTAHVQDMYDQGFRDYEMALKFQVSLEAMRYRLVNLRLQ